MKLQEVLNEFENVLKSKNAAIFENLRKGLEINSIRQLLLNFKPANSDLEILYSWHDGTDNSENKHLSQTDMFAGFCMLSLDKSIDIYNEYCLENKLWKKDFFPIFFRGGDCLLIDKNSNGSGVYYYNAYNDGLIIMYDSIETLFQTCTQCYIKDVYYLSDDGYLDADFEKETQIAIQYNPQSKFWQS